MDCNVLRLALLMALPALMTAQLSSDFATGCPLVSSSVTMLLKSFRAFRMVSSSDANSQWSFSQLYRYRTSLSA